MSSVFVPLAGLLPSDQLSLSFSHSSQPPAVAITPEISDLLSLGCAVAIGVSGGKDSQACALATFRYLDQIGHSGPRVLVSADLGIVEWGDSLPTCERLARHLKADLVVVRRKAGDMLSRWQQRWRNNVSRYRELCCVRLIMPWSSPALRFCSGELKVEPITSALKKRYLDLPIVNVSGIRRQESAARSKKPISAIEPRLMRKGKAGMTWNPIIEWSLNEVLDEISASGLALHEAYTVYGSSRVSCSFCIMGSLNDLVASSTCEGNRDAYIAMVELEAVSSYAFQSSRWLADVAPQLLSADLRSRIVLAKARASARQAIEEEIPRHLLYTKGWPTTIPTAAEADLLASVRRRISELYGFQSDYLTGEVVIERYASLMALHSSKT